MDDTSSNKSKAEGEGIVEREQQNVVMGMEILQCSVCRKVLLHLWPEIFQCSCGQLVCEKCHSSSPEKMCNACSLPFSQRAYGVERMFKNIVFPCKYGCGRTSSSYWYINQEHELACLNGPASCPLKSSSCDFIGPKAALLDHIYTVHKLLTASFRYEVQFDLPAEPGSHLLRSEDDDHVFVLTVSDSLSSGHLGVYIKPVGRFESENEYGCSVYVTWEDTFGRSQLRLGTCISMLYRDHSQDCLCFFRGRSDLVIQVVMQKNSSSELDEEED